MATLKAGATRLSKADLEARARLRRQLRLFDRFTEDAVQAQGITVSQYLLLLQVEGMPGRSWALVGELAEALVLRHHTTVELVNRCEAAGLVQRVRAQDDQRKVEVKLTALGRRKLHAVASMQHEEIERLLAHVQAALGDD
jgi:DNA-binding MarR family transcriptional regulator